VDESFSKRMEGYALKAAREGKRETSWTNPREEYERRLIEFVHGMLDPARSTQFIESTSEFARRAAMLGALNSLSQLVLKMTLPGVPDLYQGTELWDFSLVDPDNRRPIDFDLRRTLLDETRSWPELIESWRDGHIKAALMRRLLGIRQELPSLFREGDYAPILFEGADAERVIGFARTHKRQRLLVAVGRHFAARSNGGRQWPNGWDVNFKDQPNNYRDLLEPNRPDSGGFFGTLPVKLAINA
jgi:(1->4)-alpha-D-glucan 1-alpha-D-glucosylmutase